MADGAPLTRWDHIRAVSLWAPEDAVIGGWAAAYLHGEHWYSSESRHHIIDLYSDAEPRVPAGVRERRLRRPLPDDDICEIAGVRMTTPARAAVDVARWARDADRAICMIDSVCNATRTELHEVSAAAERMPRLHGVSRVALLIDQCDPLADSPQESLLRIGMARAHLPPPASQVTIYDETGRKVATADLAYEAENVAIFYDGQTNGDPEQWRFDLRVTAILADLGWEVVRVAKGMTLDEMIRHVTRALERARRAHAA